MKTALLSLSIALTILTVGVDAQVALRKAQRPQQATRRADYRQDRPVKVRQVDYDDCQSGCEDQYNYGGSDCGDGCGSHWSGGLLDGGGCGGGGCGGGKLWGDCGCASGTTTSVAYPRCFAFHSPCVGQNCDPCCRTIFAEMWCDMQNWAAALGPGSGCVGSCVRSPIGFRCDTGCGGAMGCTSSFGCGVPSLGLPPMPSFQALLTPPCSGDCGVRKRGVLSGLAGIMFGGCSTGCYGGSSCGGSSCGGSGCDSNYGNTGGYGGDCGGGNCGNGCDSCGGSSGHYGGSSVGQRDNGSSHRYYATRNPLNDRTEYVTEERMAELHQIKVDREEAIARHREQQRQAKAPRERKRPTRSANRPQRPQASRKRVDSAVQPVSFEKVELKLNGPQGEGLNREQAPPFLRFSDREFRSARD